MKIARVFPRRTSMSPDDKDAYYGLPDLFTPVYDEIYVSVTFIWDIDYAEQLASAWREYGKVKIGGVAVDGESNQPFISGMYLKKGITITSRGCINHCWYCIAKDNKLIEFDDFPEGNIIQDNNILACSKKHWELVLSMLKKQKAIEFKGGLDKYLITDKIAEDLRGLRIKSLWLACDNGDLKSLSKAIKILNKAGFNQNKLFCYVLIGKNMQKYERILKEVFRIGCMPFAQLYKDEKNSINYSKEWKNFARNWSRPAIIRAMNKHAD